MTLSTSQNRKNSTQNDSQRKRRRVDRTTRIFPLERGLEYVSVGTQYIDHLKLKSLNTVQELCPYCKENADFRGCKDQLVNAV